MMPEYPVDIPEGSRMVYIRCAIPFDLDCAMLRLEQRCNNATRQGMIVQNVDGTTNIIPVCDMCTDDMSEYYR